MITQADLKGYVNYNPLTGVFTWAKSRGFMKKGSIAGGNGRLTISNKRYKIETLLWLYMTGVLDTPIRPIGSPTDYRYANWTTLSQQTVDSKHTDVSIISNNGSYSAIFVTNGVATNIGIFSDVDVMLKALKDVLESSNV